MGAHHIGIFEPGVATYASAATPFIVDAQTINCIPTVDEKIGQQNCAQGFMRIKLLNKRDRPDIIQAAAKHNLREIRAEYGGSGKVDPERTHLNLILHGPLTAIGVAQLAKQQMLTAGIIKPRKNAVLGIEVIFGLPPRHGISETAYFTDCSAWIGKIFGGEKNILSAVIHHDQRQPHCHVLVLPLRNGKLDGSAMVGNRFQLAGLQDQFHLRVASRYGLRRAPASLSRTMKLAGAAAVVQRLQEQADPALQSPMWPMICDSIESDPASYMMELGIELVAPPKRTKTMAEIFTSPGKGPAKEARRVVKHAAPCQQLLCSVGFVSASMATSRLPEALQIHTDIPQGDCEPADGSGIYRRLPTKPVGLFTGLLC